MEKGMSSEAACLTLFESRPSAFVEKVVRGLPSRNLSFTLVEPRTQADGARCNRHTKKIPVVQIGDKRTHPSSYNSRLIDALPPSPATVAAGG
jgi:hypothetical protein